MNPLMFSFASSKKINKIGMESRAEQWTNESMFDKTDK